MKKLLEIVKKILLPHRLYGGEKPSSAFIVICQAIANDSKL